MFCRSMNNIRSVLSEKEISYLYSIFLKRELKNVLICGTEQSYLSPLLFKFLEKTNSKIYYLDTFPMKYNFIENYNLCDYLSRNKRELVSIFKGKSVPLLVSSINESFDLCLLFSNNVKPSIILDFLCVLPFLSQDAEIILLDYENPFREKEMFSPAKVIYNISTLRELNNSCGRTENIFLYFALNNSKKEIVDTLLQYINSFDWDFIPGKKILNCYGQVFFRYFTKQQMELYNQIVNDISCFNSKRNTKILDSVFLNRSIFELFRRWKQLGSPVYLYGSGELASKYIEVSKKLSLPIKSCICKYADYGEPFPVKIEPLSTFNCDKLCYIILACNPSHWEIVNKDLKHALNNNFVFI